jgi:hypothetical protein
MKAQKAFICSMVRKDSSRRSISFTVMPNSLRRCSGSPYVIQLFILITSTDKCGVRNMMRRINGGIMYSWIQVTKQHSRWNLLVDFFGLSQWIVDDIHVELNFLVDVIPVVDNRVFVCAQPDHYPHWQ